MLFCYLFDNQPHPHLNYKIRITFFQWEKVAYFFGWGIFPTANRLHIFHMEWLFRACYTERVLDTSASSCRPLNQIANAISWTSERSCCGAVPHTAVCPCFRPTSRTSKNTSTITGNLVMVKFVWLREMDSLFTSYQQVVIFLQKLKSEKAERTVERVEVASK